MASKELFLECYKALDKGLESPNVGGEISKLTTWGFVYSVTEEVRLRKEVERGSNTFWDLGEKLISFSFIVVM